MALGLSAYILYKMDLDSFRHILAKYFPIFYCILACSTWLGTWARITMNIHITARVSFRKLSKGKGGTIVKDVTKIHKCYPGGQGMLEYVCVCAGFHTEF